VHGPSASAASCQLQTACPFQHTGCWHNWDLPHCDCSSGSNCLPKYPQLLWALHQPCRIFAGQSGCKAVLHTYLTGSGCSMTVKVRVRR
jgi:hypothetical protein